MKEENILNVLMYLFQNHMQGSCSLSANVDELFEQLEQAGFKSTTISQAMDWLERLIDDNTAFIQAPQTQSTRVFSPYEKDLISFECERFILTLEQQKILNPETREILISQIFQFTPETVDLSLIKWITLMVLFNRPDSEDALACMECLVLDNALGGVH